MVQQIHFHIWILNVNTNIHFQNALMTFEEERVQDALDAFREMEKMCARDVGWLTSVRNHVFSSTDVS